MSQTPPIPKFILRGHASPIHALHFFASNLYLASGDSEGWIVIWNLSTKRPVAVWKGHAGGVMGLRDWSSERLLSHGRDHHLRVWQVRKSDLESGGGLSVRLPVDGAVGEESKWPWLLFSIAANALNYCAFGMCDEGVDGGGDGGESRFTSQLIANPNGLDAGGIDIFQLPSCKRLCRIPSDRDVQTGMVMALSIFRRPKSGQLMLISGYESGHVIVHTTTVTVSGSGEWKWQKLLCSRPHSQPLLSIDVSTDGDLFFTSSADSTVTRFKIPEAKNLDAKPDKLVDTKHAGQQDLKVRDDGKIIATAGWDKRLRVYSVKTMKELAVLKWHQEGCYAVVFANTLLDATKESAKVVSNEKNSSLVRSTLELLKEERELAAQKTHWLAAGGKDGKVSLWDIY